MSRCWRFVHFVTKSNRAWFVTVTLFCTCRWVISGHRRDSSWRPLSVSRQPSFSSTRSTPGHAPFRVWPQSRLRMVLMARSPLLFSPKKKKSSNYKSESSISLTSTLPLILMTFHRVGLQMTDSKRLQTRAILHSSQLSSHSKILTISSSDSRSNSGPARNMAPPLPLSRSPPPLSPCWPLLLPPFKLVAPLIVDVLLLLGTAVFHEAGMDDCCWPEGDGDTSVW